MWPVFPFDADESGRTATGSYGEYVEGLIKQVVLSQSRVNRPSFGTGVWYSVFSGMSGELADTQELIVHSALQQWLGDVINVESVSVQRQETTVELIVQYRLLRLPKSDPSETRVIYQRAGP